MLHKIWSCINDLQCLGILVFCFSKKEKEKRHTCCGAKGSRDFDLFHIKPKAHAEEEEMPEDKQRESRLPGYTAEDDPVLGRPKSQKGKAPRRQRQSPRAFQRKFQAQWASYRSMVEKQPQEKLSPPY